MLIGKKITLRPIFKKDLREIIKLRLDFHLNRKLQRPPFPFNEENESEWLNNIYKGSIRFRIDLIIEEKKSKKFVGIISAKNIDYLNRRCEFGVILKSSMQGKGFAKEASEIFIKYLFYEIGMERVYLEVLEENIRAYNLFESVGFKKEGLLVNHSYQEGKRKNVIIMATLKEDYIDK